MDWLDLLAVQGTLKSLLQHHSSKASILQHSAFFMAQLSYPYMTTGKTIALTRWTFVSKVMSLLFNMLSGLAIAFLSRSKHLLISGLQSPSAVIFGAQENKASHRMHTVRCTVLGDVSLATLSCRAQIWVYKLAGVVVERWGLRVWCHVTQNSSASLETCMQIKKQQLELDVEQRTGSKLGKEYIKAVYWTLLIQLICRVHHVKCQAG